MYYIQNRAPVGNCVMWWATAENGYTCDLDRAGKFDREEAERIVKGRPDIDKAWLCEDIDRLAVRHFDFQNFSECRFMPVSR
jgi:hypothetical protein